MRSERLVVIGAGPAGSAAAVQSRRLGVTPLLLDREGRAGGLVENAWRMENYLGTGPASGPEYAARVREHLARFAVDVELAEVSDLGRRDGAHIVETSAGAVSAAAVIVAVGTEPRALEVPGEADLVGSRLHYEVRHALADAPSTAAVVGGGEAAIDYALSIAGAGGTATVLVRGDRLRARGRLVEAARSEPRVNIETGCRVERLERSAGGCLVHLRRAGGSAARDFGAVLVAVGRRSAASGPLAGLDLDAAGGVSTRRPGLFVAGDARRGTLGQTGMAVGDGLEAAMAAAAFVGREARR